MAMCPFMKCECTTECELFSKDSKKCTFVAMNDELYGLLTEIKFAIDSMETAVEDLKVAVDEISEKMG